jgi:hypothetical protein
LKFRYINIFNLLIVSALGLQFTSCIKESNLNLAIDTLKIAKIYQPDGINGKDAIVESIEPDQKFGDSIHFAVFSWTNGGLFNNARALIEFDLSGIPPQTKILAAKLSFYWISYNNLTGHTGYNEFSIYKITQAWNENTVTWNTQPSISNIDSVSVSKSILTTQSYPDIDVTKLVQDMINHPNTNYGFMLKLNEEFPYKLVIMASSDYPINSKRPKLVVYY